MKVEKLTTNSPFSIIKSAVRVESGILIDEVMHGRLPTIDLNLPKGPMRIKQVQETGLLKYVVETRLQRIFADLADTSRSVYVAQDVEENVVAVGRVRIRPELNTAVLYGFYVVESLRGSSAAFDILVRCLEGIELYSKAQTERTKVRINRYTLTERKNGSISRIARLLNEAWGPGTVQTQEEMWGSQPYLQFTTTYEVFAAMVDKFAGQTKYLLW